MFRKYFLILSLSAFTLSGYSQIGEHRSNFSIGVNGGWAMSNVGFSPKVTQKQHGGISGGLSLRYTSEKYFKTLCSIYAEVNYSQYGWKENIVDLEENPVINPTTGQPEEYSRTLNYIEIPVLAHLAWGKERGGLKFFAEAGPKIGYLLSESTSTNFDLQSANVEDRANKEMSQYSMDVENRFDYGIVAGLGLEYSLPKAAHVVLDARYVYGLGNIYGDSKRDYFSKSNNSGFVVKMILLFDIGK